MPQKGVDMSQFGSNIHNNRKTTRGRKRQVINISKTVKRNVRNKMTLQMEEKEFPNIDYQLRKTAQIIHKPLRTY